MKKFKDLFIGIFVLILYFFYPYLISFLLPSAIESNFLQLIIRILFDITFMIGLFLIFKKDLIKDFKKLIKKPLKILLTSLAFLILGMVLMMISIAIIKNITNGYTPNAQIGIKELWPVVPVYGLWLTIISSPFIDEMVFRKTLKKVLPNNILFIIISCLINAFYFIGYSANSFNDVLCMIPYALFALAVSLSYLKTKTIYSPIIIHLLYNAYMLLGVILGQI